MYYDIENDIKPIEDGALKPETYFQKDKLRIMWLMKEAYESDEREGGWSLPGLYSTKYDRFYSDLVNGRSGKTWQPVIYASYGILNEFSDWDEIPFIKNDPSIVKALDNVAWVNIQKLPSETGSRTNMNNISVSYAKNKKVLWDQIDFLNPRIVLCGKTFHIIKSDLNILEKGSFEGFESVEYYLTAERVYLNANHPAQFNISREKYVNDIVYCIEKLFQNQMI